MTQTSASSGDLTLTSEDELGSVTWEISNQAYMDFSFSYVQGVNSFNQLVLHGSMQRKLLRDAWCRHGKEEI